MAQEINLATISIGPAVTFRTDINNNFELLKSSILQVEQDMQEEDTNIYAKMVDIKLSSTQPMDQKIGDFWFKDLS